MFQNHLQRIPHRIKKVSCRYLKYFSKKIGTKGFLVCALYIRLAELPASPGKTFLHLAQFWVEGVFPGINYKFYRNLYLFSRESVCIDRFFSESIIDRDMNPFELGGELLGIGFKAS